MPLDDGRCVLTGLLPSDCGCPEHRNSEARLKYGDIRFDRYATAEFEGTCSLDESHRIEPGERIGYAVTRSHGVVGNAHGWACNRCVREVKRLAPR